MNAFEISEYRVRLEGVRNLMLESGIDVLLVINEGNICYLTGYEGFSETAPQAAVVTLDEDPYLILREMDVRCAEATCWLPTEHLLGYDESYIGSDRNGWTFIGDFTKLKAGPVGRIAAELTPLGRNLGLSAIGYVKLVEVVGEVRDASKLVAQQKLVKSEQEIAYISAAAEIADTAMLAGIEKIAVGTRQSDVAAAVTAALISGTKDNPGSPSFLLPPWMPVGPVGGFPNAPHLKWSDDVYAEGQQTNFELAGFRRRYGCAVARTAFLGTPSARLKELHQGVVEGWTAAVDTMRPGATCSDVAQAFSKAIVPYRIKKESRIGYSLGVDWSDGGASLAIHDHTVLRPNMTFHVLIGIFEPSEGYNFSESVRVAENGAKSFSTLPRSLFEIPA